jgi:hypothetical protein
VKTFVSDRSRSFIILSLLSNDKVDKLSSHLLFCSYVKTKLLVCPIAIEKSPEKKIENNDAFVMTGVSKNGVQCWQCKGI